MIPSVTRIFNDRSNIFHRKAIKMSRNKSFSTFYEDCLLYCSTIYLRKRKYNLLKSIHLSIFAYEIKWIFTLPFAVVEFWKLYWWLWFTYYCLFLILYCYYYYYYLLYTLFKLIILYILINSPDKYYYTF